MLADVGERSAGEEDCIADAGPRCLNQLAGCVAGKELGDAGLQFRLAIGAGSDLDQRHTTGTDALRNASYAVAAGMYDIALVVGYEKLKDLGLSGLPVWPEIADSQVRPFLPPPFQFALSATRYFYHFNLSLEEGKRILAKIADHTSVVPSRALCLGELPPSRWR